MTFNAIIAAAGGAARLAMWLKLSRRTVGAWEEFNRIPPGHWEAIIGLGLARREDLEAAEAARTAEPRVHEAIIRRLGAAKLASLTGVGEPAVYRWQNRNQIPVRHWKALVDAGAASLEQLRRGKAPGKGSPVVRIAAEQGAAMVLAGTVGQAGAPSGRRLHAARERLEVFCRLIDVPGAPAPTAGGPARIAAHHRLWLRKLEALERGEIRRLMGFMPPGAAKSTYAVDVFTPWFLARAEQRSVLTVTYATALAARRGRKARSVARQPVFASVFGVKPAKDEARAIAWALDNGSDWMGAGMLAGITGHRADLIVIDDPVKGRAEADSETIRRRTREEFDDTVRTRLKAGGRIVLIQTRWHEDDLAGQLLPQDYDGRSGPVLCRDGEVWEVVNLPAQAERPDDPLGRAAGAMLWPEYWPDSHWAPFRLNPRTWNALYQQRPRPEEGSYFQRSCFRRFAEGGAPRRLRYYGSSDYAVSEGRGDWTRLTVWGVDAAMNLWRMASWGGQTTSEVWIDRQCELIERFRPLGGVRRWFGEAGVIRRAVEPMLIARMRERRLSCPLEWLASATDKATRARAAQALVLEGRVHVRDDSDGDCFIDECVAFPAGRWDDEVDTLSLMGRVIDRLRPPAAERAAEYAQGYHPLRPAEEWDEGEFAETGGVWD